MSVFILEGPDCGGKTTLADQLMDLLGHTKIYHATYEKGMDVKKYHAGLVQDVLTDISQGFNVIIDRLYVSEWIYGHVFRGTHYGIGTGLEFDFILKPIRIMCLPDKKTVSNAFNKRKGEEMFGEVESIYDEYEKFYNENKKDWILYNYKINKVGDLLMLEKNKYVTDVQAFLDKMKMQKIDEPGIHPMISVRVDHLQEELDELKENIVLGSLEEIIDALVDIVYIAIGTANLCGFNFDEHWDEVQRANISKEPGVTKRGHSFDAKKPEGWKGPDHKSILENKNV